MIFFSSCAQLEQHDDNVQHAGPPKSPNNIIVRRDVMTSLNAPHPIRPPRFAALRPDTNAVAKDAVTISGESVPNTSVIILLPHDNIIHPPVEYLCVGVRSARMLVIVSTCSSAKRENVSHVSVYGRSLETVCYCIYGFALKLCLRVSTVGDMKCRTPNTTTYAVTVEKMYQN